MKNKYLIALTLALLLLAPAFAQNDTNVTDGSGCGDDYAPVCGTDGNEYFNSCFAEEARQLDYTDGECVEEEDPEPELFNDEEGEHDEDETEEVEEEEEEELEDYKDDITDEELEEEGYDTETDSCTENYEPVCGEDGTTYTNSCLADEANIEIEYGGECFEAEEAEESELDSIEDLTPPEEQRAESVCREQFGVDPEEVEQDNNRGKRLKIGHIKARVEARAHLAAMNAVIDVVSEFDADTTELESIRNEYEALLTGLDEDAEAEAETSYRNRIKELKRLIKDFRETGRALPGFEGVEEDVKAAVKLAVQEVKDTAKDKLDEFRSQARETALKVFDLHICLAEEKINRLHNIGFNVDGADGALAELMALRIELVAALDAGDFALAKDIKKRSLELWKRLRKVHRAKERVKQYLKRKGQVSKAKDAILALEDAGENSHDIDELFHEMDALNRRLIALEREIAEGDSEGAARKLEKLREQARKFKERVNKKLESAKNRGKKVMKVSEAKVKKREDERKEKRRERLDERIDKRRERVDERIEDRRERVDERIEDRRDRIDERRNETGSDGEPPENGGDL